MKEQDVLQEGMKKLDVETLEKVSGGVSNLALADGASNLALAGGASNLAAPPSANVIEANSDPVGPNVVYDASYMGNAHGRDSDVDKIIPR